MVIVFFTSHKEVFILLWLFFKKSYLLFGLCGPFHILLCVGGEGCFLFVVVVINWTTKSISFTLFSVRALPFGCGWLGTCCVAQADCCVDHGDSTSVSWGLKSEVPVLYREYIQILLVSLSYDLHSFICLLFVLEGASTHMSPFVERSDDSI